jgi:FtsZ-binding cell division protein ZapB
MSTLERIKEFIDYKGITNQKFEKSIGFSNGAFASQLKNNRTIGVDKLENIIKMYPDLNPAWLLTGMGKMLLDEKSMDSESVSAGKLMVDYDVISLLQDKIGLLQDKVTLLTEQRDMQRKEIERLEAENGSLKKQIESLKKMSASNGSGEGMVLRSAKLNPDNS